MDSFGEAGEPQGTFELMFPDSRDRVAIPAQLAPGAGISAPIRSNFFGPESDAAFWDAATLRTGVPKAAIHKNRELLESEVEVGPPEDILRMCSPAGNVMLAESGTDDHLSRLVAPAFDFCHQD